jgi:protein O-mannosyl-transferase
MRTESDSRLISFLTQRRSACVCAILVIGTALLYWPVAGFDFTNFDDNLYVLNNDHVNTGFSLDGLRWCFQAGYGSNWHPLTWMSHMLDCQLFGLRPGPPHFINALLHAANSALLFLVLQRLTRTFWRSAMVAALFAWHPIHVESVAWVAERKDVLSAFFWMLTLWAYIRYVEKLRYYYGLALVFFALALMAKPMVITLPCLLLLLDWWPLGRFGPDAPNPHEQVFLEKIPFFLLSAGSGFLTMIAQNRGGALKSLELVPVAARVSNAVVCYLCYVGKLFWPANLSVMYPMANNLPSWEIALAVLFLGGISALAIVLRNSRPYGLVGWLWYLGMLLPVIGLVQVGPQSMADRYAYLPSIGIFIIVCWGVHDLTLEWRGRRPILSLVAVWVLALGAMQTTTQAKYWRNSGTLFQHALEINPDDALSRLSYGCYLRDMGRLEPARREFQRAIQIAPTYLPAYRCLSGVLEMEGRPDDAIAALRDCLKIRPDFSEIRCSLAKLLFARDLNQEAKSELEEGLKFDPGDSGLHLFLAGSLVRESKYDAADEQFAQSACLAPNDPMPHFRWALALVARHKNADAIAQYRAALQIQPDFPDALSNLAWLLAASPDAQLRNGAEAVDLAARACALTQGAEATKLGALANACAEAGRFDEAVAWAQKASEIALAHGQTNVAAQNLELKKLYQTHHAFHEYY